MLKLLTFLFFLCIIPLDGDAQPKNTGGFIEAPYPGPGLTFDSPSGKRFESWDNGLTWFLLGSDTVSHDKNSLHRVAPASILIYTTEDGREYITFDGGRVFWRKNMSPASKELAWQTIDANSNQANSMKVRVSPNPAYAYTDLILSDGVDGNITVSIVRDNKIFKRIQRPYIDPTRKTIRVDVNDLPTGSYQITVSNGLINLATSFVVIR